MEGGVRECERNNPENIKASGEGGTENVPSTRADVPLQPVVQTMVRQQYPCSPWGPAAEITCSQWRAPCWSRWRRRLWPPQEAHTGATLLTGFATPWGTHAEAIKRTAVWRKGLHWRSSWKTVSHGRHSVLELAKTVSSSPEKEGAAQTACGVEDVENLWVKLSLGKREGWGKEF